MSAAAAVSFGIVALPRRDERRFGNACALTFQVDDIDAAHRRIRAIAPRIDGAIRRRADYRSFRFIDTEGNVIEVYAVPEL